MEATLSLIDIYDALAAPFPIEVVELKPGAVSKDRTKALALAYVDGRIYQDRLDSVVGPDNWQVSYRPLPTGTGLICRLELLGVVREDVGEAPTNDPNAYTSATMQAFKRACTAFGLGRYLYSLPQTWAAYDDNRKSFVQPADVVRQLYRVAGLEQRRAA